MAFINWVSYRLFGGPADADGRHAASATTQTVLEPLTVGTTARKFKGPRTVGHYSIHFRNGAASGATSNVTVWYSNLPDPDVNDDTHWTQDTGIAAIDLTVANANTFINAGNAYPEWVRVKVVTVTSAGTCYCFIRSEGNQNQ